MSARLTRYATQHLLFDRIGIHLGAAKEHTDPVALGKRVENVRRMYHDYELAKALLRVLAKQQTDEKLNKTHGAAHAAALLRALSQANT